MCICTTAFLSFKLVFSLSCFTFIKTLFSSSLLSAIRVVSSACLLWRNVQVFPPLFDSVVCFSGSELHELLVFLEVNLMSVFSFTIIFSHSEHCVFTLPIVSFAVQSC